MKEPAPLHLDDLDDSPVPHRVKMSGHGKNLVDYVLDLIDKVPEEDLRRSVAEGRFQLADGTVLTAESRLEFGQELLVRVPRVVADDPFLPPPKKPLPFLYFDSDLLAVDKAPGLLSYPLGPRRVSALTIATRQLDARGEPSELRPLHRIDLETSGVLIMARWAEPDRRMKRAFKERRLHKSYLALVRGSFEEDTCTVKAPIGPDREGPIRIKMAVREDGQPAETRFRVLSRFGDRDWEGAGCGYTWVEAQPVTGRTHQIRVHLAHLGHPIVGDKIYCDEGVAFLRRWAGELEVQDLERLELNRHALHASKLAFQHPMTGQELSLHSPIPEDLIEFTCLRGGSMLELERRLNET